MSTKIKPLGNRVLIKRSKAVSTKGGILLPNTAQEKPKEGVVIETGPGKIDENGSTIPMDIKNGDKVMFGAYSGTVVTTNSESEEDEEYLIMSEDDILGKVTS